MLRCAYLSITALVLGGVAAVAQYTQGYEVADPVPGDWTRTIIDTAVSTSVTFKLNPCEEVLYFDANGAPKSCLARPVSCTTLNNMETMLENALAVWDDLDPGALTFTVERLEDPCSGTADCTGTEYPPFWKDDEQWVVTRTYLPSSTQFNDDNCPGAEGAPRQDGGGLRLYEDDPSDTTTRWVRECDLVFTAKRWDNSEDDCLVPHSPELCANAWLMALAHESAHCLGLGHSYLTRRSLEPLEGELPITLKKSRPSIMSYDRVGTIQVGTLGNLNPYDEAAYLYAYSSDPDPNGDHFAAYGMVKYACPDGNPLFGAAVVALEEDGTEWAGAHISMTGMPPLDPGEFRLDHLDRSKDYRLLVVDSHDLNDFWPNGWDFDGSPILIPGLKAVETDAWSVQNSGEEFKEDMRPHFDDDFAYELGAEFWYVDGDHDAQCIDVD